MAQKQATDLKKKKQNKLPEHPSDHHAKDPPARPTSCQ